MPLNKETKLNLFFLFLSRWVPCPLWEKSEGNLFPFKMYSKSIMDKYVLLWIIFDPMRIILIYPFIKKTQSILLSETSNYLSVCFGHTQTTKPINQTFGMKTWKTASWKRGNVRLTKVVIWGHHRSINLLLSWRLKEHPFGT